jgi:hypothetical protein
MNNEYEVKNIIRKTGTDMFGSLFEMPKRFDDSKAGYGITFKYIAASKLNRIWPTVIEKLHNLGLTNWYESHPLNTEDRNEITYSKWKGIRSAHPRRGH